MLCVELERLFQRGQNKVVPPQEILHVNDFYSNLKILRFLSPATVVKGAEFLSSCKISAHERCSNVYFRLICESKVSNLCAFQCCSERNGLFNF